MFTLKEVMHMAQVTQVDLAEEMDMHPATFNRKMNHKGDQQFTKAEKFYISCLLNVQVDLIEF